MPITVQLAELLRRHPKRADSQFVFPSRTGNREQHMLDRCKAVAARAELDAGRFDLKTFRSTYATRMLRASSMFERFNTGWATSRLRRRCDTWCRRPTCTNASMNSKFLAFRTCALTFRRPRSDRTAEQYQTEPGGRLDARFTGSEMFSDFPIPKSRFSHSSPLLRQRDAAKEHWREPKTVALAKETAKNDSDFRHRRTASRCFNDLRGNWAAPDPSPCGQFISVCSPVAAARTDSTRVPPI